MFLWGYVDRCPSLLYDVYLWSIYFLALFIYWLKPSIGKRRKQSCTPNMYVYIYIYIYAYTYILFSINRAYNFIIWEKIQVYYNYVQVINFDSPRGGISLVTEKGPETTSRLMIQKAVSSDSGIYRCEPSNANPSSIKVHVVNGELKSTLSIYVIKFTL